MTRDKEFISSLDAAEGSLHYEILDVLKDILRLDLPEKIKIPKLYVKVSPVRKALFTPSRQLLTALIWLVALHLFLIMFLL